MAGPARLLLALLLALPAGARPRTPQPGLAAAEDAAVVARQAKAYYGQHKYELAAELYARAYQLNRARPEYLYGVGRAQQLAGHPQEARTALENLRQLLPAHHPLQAKAAEALAQLRAQESTGAADTSLPAGTTTTDSAASQRSPRALEGAADAAAPSPDAGTPRGTGTSAGVGTAAGSGAPPGTAGVAGEAGPVTPTVARADAERPAAGAGAVGTATGAATPGEPSSHVWTQVAMWSGGAAILTGIGLAIGAEVKRGQLVDDLGLIRGTEAADRQRGINSLSTAALVAVAAGAGGLALGLYWRIGERADRTPVVTLSPQSLELSWRF